MIFTNEINNISAEESPNMFHNRCNDSLSKEKADEYAKCDALVTQTIKGLILHSIEIVSFSLSC